MQQGSNKQDGDWGVRARGASEPGKESTLL
jgi:hypothetical protein